MIQRIVDHRQYLIRHGLPIDGPLSLEDFWRNFCSRIDLDNRGMAGLFTWIYQPRILEPHEYFFEPAYHLMNCYMLPTVHCGVIVGVFVNPHCRVPHYSHMVTCHQQYDVSLILFTM